MNYDELAAYTYALDIEADMERKRRLHDWDGAWWELEPPDGEYH